MITPNTEPTTTNNTKAIATFTQRTLSATIKDGLIFDAQKQFKNVANSFHFSSDRSILEFAEKIWNLF